MNLSEAAQTLGRSKSIAKATSSRRNGKNSVQPHILKTNHFTKHYPYRLENNEWKVKFNLGVKTKTGKEATYNPDFYCPKTGYYIEVATSKSNLSLQGWKWEKVIKLGHKLKVYWWEGKEITNDYR